jgi:hypothetical protein
MTRSLSICNHIPFLSQLRTQGGCSGAVAGLRGGTIPVSSKITLQANQISDKGVVLCPSFFPVPARWFIKICMHFQNEQMICQYETSRLDAGRHGLSLHLRSSAVQTEIERTLFKSCFFPLRIV